MLKSKLLSQEGGPPKLHIVFWGEGCPKNYVGPQGGGGQKCPKFRPHGLWMPPAYLYRLSLTFGRSSLLACACQHSLWMFPYPILIAIRKIKVSRFSHSIENIFLWLNSRSTSTRNLFIRTLTDEMIRRYFR